MVCMSITSEVPFQFAAANLCVVLCTVDRVAAPFGTHPGEVGREHPRAVGRHTHRAGLDLWIGE